MNATIGTTSSTLEEVVGSRGLDRPVPLETRMEITSVGMDVRLKTASAAVSHSNAESVRAVAEALASASSAALASERTAERKRNVDEQTPEGVLLRAADVIRERGWTQNQLVDLETGAVCARGAVLVAGGGHQGMYTDEAMNLLLFRIKREYPFVPDVPEWNDSPFGSRHGLLRFLEMNG